MHASLLYMSPVNKVQCTFSEVIITSSLINRLLAINFTDSDGFFNLQGPIGHLLISSYIYHSICAFIGGRKFTLAILN